MDQRRSWTVAIEQNRWIDRLKSTTRRATLTAPFAAVHAVSVFAPPAFASPVFAVPVFAVPVFAVSGFHDVHVSHMRVVVEGPTVAAQVRLFHDDLQDAVRRHARQPALVLSSPAGDSAFARYFAQGVTVTADGTRLTARLLQARDDRDSGGVPMRVYTVELAAARPVRRLALRDALLFEHFRDQQNLAVVLRLPGERRTSLFFAAGDTREQVVPE
jgi:hypothetical protein